MRIHQYEENRTSISSSMSVLFASFSLILFRQEYPWRLLYYPHWLWTRDKPFWPKLCSSDDWQVKSVQSATQCTAQFLNLCWLLLLCLEPAGFLAENNKVWLSLLLYFQLGAQLSWNWVCGALLQRAVFCFDKHPEN